MVSFSVSAIAALLALDPEVSGVRVVGWEFCWWAPAAMEYAGPDGGWASLMFDPPRPLELPFGEEVLDVWELWPPNELVRFKMGVVTDFDGVVAEEGAELLDEDVEFCNRDFGFLGDGAGWGIGGANWKGEEDRVVKRR